jgi:hypothetical protein
MNKTPTAKAQIKNLEKTLRKCLAEVGRLEADGWVEDHLMKSLLGAVQHVPRAHRRNGSGIDVKPFVEAARICVQQGRIINKATRSAILSLEKVVRETRKQIEKLQTLE